MLNWREKCANYINHVVPSSGPFFLRPMFFSTEILTRKNSGFSTAWLMATLGSKPHATRISKSDILATAVPQVCGMIETPPGPLALRLSSQLMYGVALIHRLQMGYLLADVSVIRARLMHDNPFRLNNAGKGEVNMVGEKRGRNELRNDAAFSLDLFLLPPGPPPLLSPKAAAGDGDEEGDESGVAASLGSITQPGGAQGRQQLQRRRNLAEITLPADHSVEYPAGRDVLGTFMKDWDETFSIGYVSGYGCSSSTGGGDGFGDEAGEGSLVEFGFGEDGEMIELPVTTNRNTNTNKDENEMEVDVADPALDLDADMNLGLDLDMSDLDLADLKSAALASRLTTGTHPRYQSTPARPLAPVLTGPSPTTGSKKRVCPFDPVISVPIDALRSYRDNYSANMAVASATNNRKQQRLAHVGVGKSVSATEYLGLALGAPFSAAFKSLTSLTPNNAASTSNRTRPQGRGQGTPSAAEIEVGRAAVTPTSYRQRGSSFSFPSPGFIAPGSAGGGDRSRPASSARAGHNSDLDSISELPSNGGGFDSGSGGGESAFEGYNHVYNYDFEDLEISIPEGGGFPVAENGNDGECAGRSGQGEGDDLTNDIMAQLLDASGGPLLFDNLVPLVDPAHKGVKTKTKTRKRKAAAVFAVVLKLATTGKVGVRQEGVGGGIEVWV